MNLRKYRNRLFFIDGRDEVCYNLKAIVDIMKYEGLTSIDLIMAKEEKGTGFFFCKHFGEVGEKGHCGANCGGYKARNGKAGICVHHGSVYSHTDYKCTYRLFNRRTDDATRRVFNILKREGSITSIDSRFEPNQIPSVINSLKRYHGIPIVSEYYESGDNIKIHKRYRLNYGTN